MVALALAVVEASGGVQGGFEPGDLLSRMEAEAQDVGARVRVGVAEARSLFVSVGVVDGPGVAGEDVVPFEVGEGEAACDGPAALQVEVVRSGEDVAVVAGVAGVGLGEPGVLCVLGLRGVAVGHGVAGDGSHEVVQAVALGVGVMDEEAACAEVAEGGLGVVGVRVPDGGGRGGVEGDGEHGEHLPACGAVGVVAGEGASAVGEYGAYVEVRVVADLECGALFLEGLDVIGRCAVGVGVEEGAGDA